LKALLQNLGAKELIVFGLAMDYCVRATVLHALEEGFAVTLITSLTRGVTPEGAKAAMEEMKASGVRID
jgi:nicotinamidase/pyrazinamidase